MQTIQHHECPHSLYGGLWGFNCSICRPRPSRRRTKKSAPASGPTFTAADIATDLPANWADAVEMSAVPLERANCEVCPLRGTTANHRKWVVNAEAPFGKWVAKVHKSTHRDNRGKRICDECCNGRCGRCLEPREVIQQTRKPRKDLAEIAGGLFL